MKKLLAVLLACLLFLLCAMPCFADSMTISTGATEDAWALSYPADTQIPWESSTHRIGEVKAEKMLLSPGKTVAVTVESANDYRLMHQTEADSTIAYTLLGAETIAFLPGDYGKAFPLSVTVEDTEWQKAAAGEHKDLLTFTAEYKDA
ncbi:MAG: hypothetical protein ACI4K9_08710 [Candidatus Fimenecus sp.]